MNDLNRIHAEYHAKMNKRVRADLKRSNKTYAVWIPTDNPKLPMIRKKFKSLDSAKKFALELCIADAPYGYPNEIGRRMCMKAIVVLSKDNDGDLEYTLGYIAASCEGYRGNWTKWRYTWTNDWIPSRGSPSTTYRITKSGKLSKRQD